MFSHNETFYGGEIISDPNKHIKVIITPEVATEMLQHNNNNRSVKVKTVAAYARDMENGLWRKNDPNALIFSDTGELVDGQHRLKAVLKSGATIPMNVTVLAPNTKAVVDRQALRTTRDVLKMAYNHELNNQQIAAIRLWRVYEIHDFKPFSFAESAYKISDEEIEQTYFACSDVWDMIFSLNGARTNGVTRRSMVYTAIFAAYRCGVRQSFLESILKTLASGLPDEGLTRGQANITLIARNYLLAINGKSANASNVEGLLEEYIYRAVSGNEVKKRLSSPTWHYTKQFGETRR